MFVVQVSDYPGLGDPVQAIGVHKPRKFTNLAAASKYANRTIERPATTRTVIEIVQQSGPVKYRLERDAVGHITRTPLV